MKIVGKIFVVTGAGGGIGGELVLGLLAGGAKVIGLDIDKTGLSHIKERAGQDNDNLTTHHLDVTDNPAVQHFASLVIKESGPVDAIINCAGVIQPFVKIDQLELEDIDRVMDINFYGTLYMVKAFLPHLLERPDAYIVNVSSMGGFLPIPGQSVYGASKAAVKLFTEALYAELMDTSVNVSIVLPGATKTNISRNSGVVVRQQTGSKKQIKMLSPQNAANQIIRGIEKNKMQIFTGTDSRLMSLVCRISPVFAVRLIEKQMHSLISR